MSKYISLIKSRRFQTAAIGLVVIVGSHFGFKLSAEELLSFSLIVSSWIWGDSIRRTEEPKNA
jgi:hypothetical protein